MLNPVSFKIALIDNNEGISASLPITLSSSTSWLLLHR